MMASTSPVEAGSKPDHYDAVIVGGGPAGLLSAIMAARQLPPLAPPLATGGDDGGTLRRPRIAVYDRLPPPPPPDDPAYSADVSRYYLLGLGHRGQRALRHLDAWDDVEAASVAVQGRRDWAPGKSGEDESTIRMANKAVASRVLARDKLVGVLKGVIERRYGDSVELRYGWEVDPVSFGNEEDAIRRYQEGDGRLPGGSGPPVTLRVSRCIPVASLPGEEGGEECSIESIDDDGTSPTTITTSLLVGADGAARTIANAMEVKDLERRRRQNLFGNLLKRIPGLDKKEPWQESRPLRFQVKRYEDDNPRVYKSVPIQFPPHWPHDLNYSARSRDSRVTFEALPSDSDGNYCALLLLRPNDPLASPDCDPMLLRQMFDEEFPQFSKLLSGDVVSDVARKGASALPGFRYAGPRIHEGGRTVLLGDCVHTVKPYYGLGANTALEDVQIFSEILSSTPDLSQNLHRAVWEFTRRRAVDSRSLVTLSRGMDRPGKLGTLRFVAPLILDSAFHKVAPWMFAPSMFGMFQLEGLGFSQIQRRKRLDRAMQSLIVLGSMWLAGAGARGFVRGMARVLGVGDLVAGGSLAALLGAAAVSRKIFKAEIK